WRAGGGCAAAIPPHAADDDRAGIALGFVHCESSVNRNRRDCPHAVPTARLAQASPRMGDSGSRRGAAGGGVALVRRDNGLVDLRCGCVRVTRLVRGGPSASVRVAVASRLAGLAGRRVLGQPTTTGSRPTALTFGSHRAAAYGPQDLAVLRDVR